MGGNDDTEIGVVPNMGSNQNELAIESDGVSRFRFVPPGLSCCDYVGTGLKKGLKFFFIVFVLIPAAVIACSFLFGTMLAKAEGWTIMDGFYIVVGNICGLVSQSSSHSIQWLICLILPGNTPRGQGT